MNHKEMMRLILAFAIGVLVGMVWAGATLL
jgi:hypothetical protein